MTKIGPTGKFPQGKIDKDDKGELVIGVAYDAKKDAITIEFGAAVTWLGMDRETAVRFANMLVDAVLKADEERPSAVPEKPMTGARNAGPS